MKIIRLILVFLLLTANIASASWTNIITNYTRKEYKAGSQNWQIMQHDNFRMYFANKMGVLEFSGIDWKLYTLNNHSDVRSLLKSTQSDRIYVAGANEFGYLEPDTIGHLAYHCLLSDALKNQIGFGNIWRIYEVDNSIYFCADHSVLKLSEGKITVINSPDKIDCSLFVGNTLYIGTNSGIYILAGETFYNLDQTEPLKNKKLRELLLFNDKILVATALDGLFILDKKELTPFETEVDDFIKHNELFSIAFNKGKIAIGTILKGAVLISETGEVINYFNESHGLQNNTILSVYFDNNNNLWLGLDNGIALVNLNSPIKNLYSAVNFYGAGYAVALYNNKLYLGTNQGLYYIDWPVRLSESNSKLQLVENMQGQVWGLTVIDNELICCLDRGLFMLKGGKKIDLNLKTGVWKFRPLSKDKNKALISTYNGFYLMERKNDSWQNPVLINGFSNSIINFEEENGVIFARDNWNELIKITLDDSFHKINSIEEFTSPQIPPNYYIYKIQEDIKLCSPESFFRYNGNMFEKDQELNRLFPVLNKNSYYSLAEKDGTIWTLGNKMISVVPEKIQETFSYFHNIPLISNFENLLPISDSSVIICNEDGFSMWNMNERSTPQQEILRISHVMITNPSDSLIYVSNFTNKKTIPEIDYIHNSLRFYFNKINYGDSQEVFYRCKMDKEPWQDSSSSNTKDYSGLGVGKHIFRVETITNSGKILYDEFTFVILPPWYRTNLAYFIYILLFTLFLIGLWYMDDIRIRRKKLQIEQKQRREMQVKEEIFRIESEKKEEEIIQLKHEQLEMIIKHKNQELANVAIILAQKNETLTEIKNDLAKVSGTIKNDEFEISSLRRNLLRINNKIEGNIIEDDSLKKFENHFDLVHNNFMQRLSEQYPELTLNERKMCAFIKMQLSSKEMAPLLNISIRGVETLRYRLRKKIGLNREESLTIFLNNF